MMKQKGYLVGLAMGAAASAAYQWWANGTLTVSNVVVSVVVLAVGAALLSLASWWKQR